MKGWRDKETMGEKKGEKRESKRETKSERDKGKKIQKRNKETKAERTI